MVLWLKTVDIYLVEVPEARVTNQGVCRAMLPPSTDPGSTMRVGLTWAGSLLWNLMQRTDSLEKTLMLGKIEGRKRRGRQRMRWLASIRDSTDLSLSNSGRWWRTGKPGVLQSMGLQRVRHDWVIEQNKISNYAQVRIQKWCRSPWWEHLGCFS